MNQCEYVVEYPKSIVYNYLFNYFGEDSFKGKTIVGAGIRLVIRAYKNGEEVKFMKEPKYEKLYFCDNYDVVFDREKLFVIKKNHMVDNIFKIAMEWDKIEAEIEGYFLDYLSSLPEEIAKELPEILKDVSCAESMDVSEEEFAFFVREHLNDFCIADNKKAQVPSVSFI